MKIRNEFVLREIAGEYVLIPTGSNSLDFGGFVSTNEVGYFIWEQLKDEKTLDELVDSLLDEFEIDYDIAKRDTINFVEQLKKHELIVE